MIEQLTAMPQYKVYKDSGVEWLGTIPGHWDVKPGFTIFAENKRNNRGMKESQVLSLSYGNIVIKPEEKLVGLVPESFETYQLVEPGDIIVRCTDLQNDQTSLRTGLARDRGIITSAYLNLLVKEGNDSRYWHYYLHSLDTTKVIYKFGSGLRQNLSYLDFKRLPIFDITLPEQTAIAAFLDRKTAQIDQAVAIKEKQIALLKERKQILIQNAVTHGLDPNAPMRDSGVEWIGEIPAHWDIKKLKYIVRFVSGATPSKDRAEYWNGTIPWISPKDMKRLRIDSSIDYITDIAIKNSNIRLLDIGTILIVVRGMILAKKIPVALSKVSLTINQDIKGMIPDKMYFHEYLLYLLDGINEQISTLLEDSGHGTKTLPTEKLGQLTLGIPPKYEQVAIVAHIETESAKIDRAISLQQQQIDKLKEYKATLIESAVTGKIRVPELVEGSVPELADSLVA